LEIQTPDAETSPTMVLRIIGLLTIDASLTIPGERTVE
jgi:hypothetical protein